MVHFAALPIDGPVKLGYTHVVRADRIIPLTPSGTRAAVVSTSARVAFEAHQG